MKTVLLPVSLACFASLREIGHFSRKAAKAAKKRKEGFQSARLVLGLIKRFGSSLVVKDPVPLRVSGDDRSVPHAPHAWSFYAYLSTRFRFALRVAIAMTHAPHAEADNWRNRMASRGPGLSWSAANGLGRL